MNSVEQQKNSIRKLVVIFGGIFMLVGLIVMAYTLKTYFFGEKSRFWSKTMGKIVSAEVLKNERSYSDKGMMRSSIKYKPNVLYSYSVNGQNYTNNRISFSSIGGSNINKSRDYVSRFKVGSSIPVYYDGDNHQSSTLVKGTSKLNVVAIISGIAFFLFGLLVYKLRNVYANSIPD